MNDSDETKHRTSIRQHVVSGGSVGVEIKSVTADVLQIGDRLPDGIDSIEYTCRLLLSHDLRLNRLVGFSEFLGEAKLPFVAPPKEDAAHPEQLWRVLQHSLTGGGVLVWGAGGVGKTRAAVEVACLAARRGWKVFWLLHAEHMPTPGMLEGALDRLVGGLDRAHALLVLDYADQMIGINLDTLSQHFRNTNVQVRLLATSRPLRSADLVRGSRVTYIQLSLSREQQSELIRSIFRRVSPRALDRLGEPALAQLCGKRPVLALLIARSLEQCEGSGDATDVFLQRTRMRGQELFIWLDERLRTFIEDLERTFGLGDDDPTVIVRLVGCILGLAPLRQQELQAGARETARRLGVLDSELASDLVILLREAGWLECVYGQVLRVAHDTVADQALQAALSHTRHSARRDALLDVLEPACHDARALGRLATSISRMLASSDADFRKRVEDDIRVWWASNVERLGKTIACHDPEITGYAIGALFKWTPWQAIIVHSWDDILGPWLSRHGHCAAARHVLYLSLRNIRRGASRLLSAARIWLSQNGSHFDASYVLAPLLSHPELPPEMIDDVMAAAAAWLDEHGAQREAHFILCPVLELQGGSRLLRQNTHAVASNWLERHGQTHEAKNILWPLLKQLPHLDEEIVAERVFQWLEHHFSPRSGAILGLLISRAISANVLASATAHALRWLEIHHETRDAWRPLTALLKRSSDLDTVSLVMGWARRWLRGHRQHKKVGLVIRVLVGRCYADRMDDLVPPIVEEAFYCLRSGSDEPGLGQVLRRIQFLLGGRQFPPDVVVGFARAGATWLQAHADDENADRVINTLFDERVRMHLGSDVVFDLARSGLRWLRRHCALRQATHTLRVLLDVDAGADFVGSVVDCSVMWLRCHGERVDAYHILGALLRRQDIENSSQNTLADLGVRWLRANGGHVKASYILPRLLRVASLPEVVMHALLWVERHGESPDGDQVLVPLLMCRELTRVQWRTIADLAERRLRRGDVRGRKAITRALRKGWSGAS